MKILVTGCAGFIGAALAKRLLERGDEIIGVDNLNDYYGVRLKQDRLARVSGFEKFDFRKLDILDANQMESLFKEVNPECVLHLAAQAGVRYSVAHPHPCIDSNISGFLNILEGCRATGVGHLVYASSSSIYGANEKIPFSESDPASRPISLYGATKRANELMAYSYSHLFDISMTALRYFTVYGPWGRPDMSPILFTEKIYAGEPLRVFNQGRHQRDFTYIDDAVEATLKVMDKIPARDVNRDAGRPVPASASARHRIYNVGNQNAINLMDYIKILETEIGKKAIIRFTEAQPGDALKTLSDSSRLKKDIGFEARIPIERGIKKFIDWYKHYYGI